MPSLSIVADRVQMEWPLFQTPGLQHALVVFRCALAAGARAKLTRRVIKGRKPEPEAGQIKLLHAVSLPSTTIGPILFGSKLSGTISDSPGTLPVSRYFLNYGVMLSPQE
ncbi:unnamed protein product [Ixodes pacificus]